MPPATFESQPITFQCPAMFHFAHCPNFSGRVQQWSLLVLWFLVLWFWRDLLPVAQFGGLSLQASRAEHDHNHRHHNRERHPILDMNAKGVDPIDKHLHGRFPRFWAAD